MQNVKEYWQKLSDKTKKLLIAIVGGTAAVVIIGVLALNLVANRDYIALFTGLSQEEAQEVVAYLQDNDYTYRYDDKDGSIDMPASSVEQARIELLSQGYPKSGFNYDIYRDNAGLMTTESDKKQYTQYDLQDRLGATIRLFEGVKDAKVNIAYSTDSKYALSDNEAAEASAAVTVTMKSGYTLSENQAGAIKTLVSRSVQGMNFTEVAVIDAETMLEVGGSSTGSKEYTELSTQIENNIAANVRRVLEKLYGVGTTAVSVKGTLNMEKLIQESIQYTTPEKIDEQDKTGLLETEDVVYENSEGALEGAGGVTGADANADTPRYTNEDEDGAQTEAYGSGSASRYWLFDSVKEQRQIDPGVLENVTIAIVIDTDDRAIPDADLINLVADAAGITREDARTKISIIRALSPESRALQEAVTDPDDIIVNEGFKLTLPIIIALIAGGLLLLLLIIFLILRGRRKKKAQMVEGEEGLMAGTAQEEWPEGAQVMPETEVARQFHEADAEMEQNEEILNLRMQRSLRLKQNIGEFIDQNPQIAAKLMQSWLRGEVESSGRTKAK